MADDRAEKLRAARELADEMAAERGPVTPAETAAVRAQWPLVDPLPGATVYECPVDGCGAVLDAADARPKPGLFIGPGAVARAVERIAAGVDKMLAEHAATHAPVEYLRTIQRLRGELAERDRQAATAVGYRKLPDGYATESVAAGELFTPSGGRFPPGTQVRAAEDLRAGSLFLLVNGQAVRL